ncbi:hypothetical protein [Sinorhizobium psoraleae]|uniref:Uncharacterized protein n=1 Tax=Sinorhizobium psoraleae TaxID=520838 RepID=A0ABT4KA57_9HYPH|nr:hypothetical protein [Sinorhizobium psoraleae]MCZ4088837.1 hypothetical protein [Sinorhizobium psoraleae]
MFGIFVTLSRRCHLHIAARDNVVRKLTQEGKQPFSVGLFVFGRSFLGGRAGVLAIAATCHRHAG